MAFKPSKLGYEAQAKTGFTHQVVIDHNDFTATGNTQSFTLSVPAGMAVGKAFHRLVSDFDSSDASLTSLTYIVGDGGSTNRFLTSTQVCVDGTEVDYKAGALSDYYVYTVADTIDIAFTATTGKDISTLNTGKLVLFLQMFDSKELA